MFCRAVLRLATCVVRQPPVPAQRPEATGLDGHYREGEQVEEDEASPEWLGHVEHAIWDGET